MRNFEERMDAIRSRSKARIAQRRKQISAVCVPLILCIVFTGVYFGTRGNQAPAGSTQQTIISTTLSGVVVTDFHSGQILSRTDSQQPLSSYISQLQIHAGRVQEHLGTAYTAEESSTITQNRTAYTIVLTDEQGNTQKFILRVGYLTDTANDIVYKISASQYQRIMELAGLSK